MKWQEEFMNKEENETVTGEVVREFKIKNRKSDLQQIYESMYETRDLDPGKYKLVKVGE